MKSGVSRRKSSAGETKFRAIEPKILYFGNPVALISWLNEDGTTDLAPISSFWALGWTLVLGLLTPTKTADNFYAHRECVVNVPSPERGASRGDAHTWRPGDWANWAAVSLRKWKWPGFTW